MRVTCFSDMNCSIAGALEAIGDRWGFLLMRDLIIGLGRYDEFRASSGIPTQTLADRLRHLEESGLIERRRYKEHPPRDEYVLTRKGQDFWMVLTALREWGDRWHAHGGKAPPLALIDGKSGNPLRLALVDEREGSVVSRERARLKANRSADAQMKFRLETGARRRVQRSA